MLNIGVKALTMVGMLFTVVNSQFTDAICGKAIIQANGVTGRVQCNYKLQASKRFTFDGTVQKLTAFTDDEPHSTTANGKDPRTEVTLSDHYSYGSGDVATFEGQFKVSADVTEPFALF
jgi:hypothetical protein